MYCGIKKGFTLVEVIISILIGSMIILGLTSTYFVVVKIGDLFLRIKKKENISELLLTLQRGLFTAREITITKKENIYSLTYITNYGLSFPYVKVYVEASNNKLIYEERNPYGKAILYRKEFPLSCKLNKKKQYISLSCRKFVIDIPFNREKHFILR